MCPSARQQSVALAAGQLQALLGQVDADDPLGSLQPAPRDRAQADHPGAEHDARRAGLHPGGVHRRAQSRGEAAREQAGAIERGLAIDLGQRDLGDDRVLGERRGAHEVPDRLPPARQPRAPVREVALVLLLADRQAQVRARAAAVDALAALRREQRHDVVADLEAGDSLAERLDHSCALVSEHGRGVAGRVDAGGGVHVGVTYATGDEPHEHLAGPGIGQLQLLHDQRTGELLQQRRANPHAGLLTGPTSRPGA